MECRIFFTLLLVFLSALSVTDAYTKKCIPYCGNATGIVCPSGYSCQDWDGCGGTCHRMGKYQEDDCPMVKCMANDCPLGFERDEEGCEGCGCASMDAIKALDAQDYGGLGSASRLAVHASVFIGLVSTIVCYLSVRLMPD